jgi:predicted DNA-binding ribbon-helix-helix protein
VVSKYRGTIGSVKEIARVQTGVRLESRLVKVLKALATELDLSLGDLLEGIVLHALEDKAPFSTATLKKIKALKSVYGLDLTADDSHRLREVDGND